MSGEGDTPGIGGAVRAAPGLARIAAAIGRRAAADAAGAYVNGASRMVRAASRGESAAQILEEGRDELRSYLRDWLGVGDGAARQALPTSMDGSGGEEDRDASVTALRRRGEELLRRSADIGEDTESHPAYMRILDALAPDEARILRFLAAGGPQPSVDIRAGVPFASQLVAQGCTMIAEEAGCRHRARLHAYLDNLHRLGLVWFSREPLRDVGRYQVLEAQPEVTDALERVGRTGRTVRRSIVLTPFGEDFCAVCLPLE
jgi:hypothetical protein